MAPILKFGLFSMFIILLSGCSTNDDEKNTDQSILGTQKLIEAYSSSGAGPGEWRTIENGYTYTFSLDGSFTSTRFSECNSGTYDLDASRLKLDFDCEDFTSVFENEQGLIVEKYRFESGQLILTPDYLNCTEGCAYKFEK